MASIEVALKLYRDRRLPEARAELRSIKGIAKTLAGATLLGGIETELHDYAAALPLLKTALRLDPANRVAHIHMARSMEGLGRLDEALVCFERALALRETEDIFLAWAWVLHRLARFDEAEVGYDRALALRSAYPDAIASRGMTRLLQGDYERGLADYEARFDRLDTPVKRPNLPGPLWTGGDLRDKRLLVHSEQGLGDAIQFCRFLPDLVRAGATVVFAPFPSLQRLLKPFVQQIDIRTIISTDERFDGCVALGSLLHHLKVRPDRPVQGDPYLQAEPELVTRWRDLIGREGFRIGVAWQGNPASSIDQGRSYPLAILAPLARVPGVRLISLQKKHGVDQLDRLPKGMTVEQLSAPFDEGPDAFVDTAAIMANLDLVVTSDTSVTHLAGALGRPTFLLLQKVPDWRWGLEGESTFWYPSLRLVRQSRFGDWGEVGRRVARQVEARLAQGGAVAGTDAM